LQPELQQLDVVLPGVLRDVRDLRRGWDHAAAGHHRPARARRPGRPEAPDPTGDRRDQEPRRGIRPDPRAAV